jgi:Flp pilus assembly protein protease CpaA
MIVELIILIGLLLGSYTDIKTREIPDTLSFSLIFLGIAIALCTSISFWSYKPLLASALGLACGTLIGLVSYYTGQWGGGDAKILMGMGSLIGLDIFILGKGFPLLGTFLVNLVIAGAIYGIFWLLSLAVKHWHTFRIEFREARRKSKIIKFRIALLALIVLFTAVVFILKPDLLITFLLYLILLFAMIFLYMSIIIKTIEKTCLIKKISVKKLTEGDWIVEKVKLKNAAKHIYTKTGITTQGIQMLKRSGKKTITVKEGIPFVPSFLLAYLITLALGNWLPF